MKTIKDVHTISTKKGDKGTSKNYSNETFLKGDLLFEAVGTIDELSSFIGLSYHHSSYKDELQTIQKILQHINSLIATSDDTKRASLRQVTKKDITFLEDVGQKLLDQTVIQPKFVLPGSDASLPGAYFDVTRSVCRRAERVLVRFKESHKRDDLYHAMAYINRLADTLFLFARVGE